MPIYSFWAAKLAFLLTNKALIKILFKYLEYTNIFLTDLAIMLLEHNGMNDYIIKLVNNKKPYGPIYNLGPVKLETIKIYIKNNLKTGFIQPSKFLVSAFIFFYQQSNKIFCLSNNYQGLNNLTIKNWYFFPVISKF